MEDAHKNFVYGNYSTAIEMYSKLIESQPDNPDLFIYRAIAYTQISQYDPAIHDLEKSEKLRPKNFQTNLRLGIALFHKGCFAEALTAFKTAESLTLTESEKILLSGWIQKSLSEQGLLSASKFNESALMPGFNKFEAEELKKGMPLYDWYQSATYVNMNLKMKGLSNESLNVTFGTQEFDVVIKLQENDTREYSYKLFMEIIPDQCSYTVDYKKVEIKLKKKDDGIHWTSFEKVEKKTEYRPSYPSSAKKKVDWNKIDKEAEKETAKDKPEGDEALNNLFKAIYE